MRVDDDIVALSAGLLPECAAMFAAIFSAPPWNERWTVETATCRLTEILQTPGSMGVVWIEPETAQPAGLAAGHLQQGATERVFRLAEFCVHPEWQGKGIGSRLLTQLERSVAELGAHAIFLTTEGRPVSFYARHGYVAHPEWVAMSRSLDPI
jgi:GNAT superfamily N-acetyltransferase